MATIELAAYEVINIAERRWHDAAASARLRQRLWAIAELGTLGRADRQLTERTAELAREHQLSAYDAAYVAAAQRLSLPLASCDSATSSLADWRSCLRRYSTDGPGRSIGDRNTLGGGVASACPAWPPPADRTVRQ